MFPRHIRTPRAVPGPPSKGPVARVAGRVVTLIWGTIVAVALAIGFGPGLPDRLNPFAPLDPMAEPNRLTAFKLGRAVADTETCLTALAAIRDVRFASLLDRTYSEECYIEGHVELRRLSHARLLPEPTSCQTALRLYMWERHVVQPAALRWYGEQVSDIADLGSYSCRRINTPSGPGEHMSSHATASAIDISAVTLESGRTFQLITGWTGRDEQERGFWRDLRDGACRYFKTVLSPDFNSLHKDHFHLGQDRYGACR